jgi:hypothetical protein
MEDAMLDRRHFLAAAASLALMPHRSLALPRIRLVEDGSTDWLTIKHKAIFCGVEWAGWRWHMRFAVVVGEGIQWPSVFLQDRLRDQGIVTEVENVDLPCLVGSSRDVIDPLGLYWKIARAAVGLWVDEQESEIVMPVCFDGEKCDKFWTEEETDRFIQESLTIF